MGLINDIMEEFKHIPHIGNVTDDCKCGVCLGLRSILEKHLEPQKKAEECATCGEEGLCWCDEGEKIEVDKRDEQQNKVEEDIYEVDTDCECDTIFVREGTYTCPICNNVKDKSDNMIGLRSINPITGVLEIEQFHVITEPQQEEKKIEPLIYNEDKHRMEQMEEKINEIILAINRLNERVHH